MYAKKDDIAFTKVKLPYGWLGNLSRYNVYYDGKEWGSTEHLFQAMRFMDDDEGIEYYKEIVEEIRNEKGPYQAKQKAKEYVNDMIIEMMGDEDVENMEFCIKLKSTMGALSSFHIPRRSEKKPLMRKFANFSSYSAKESHH